MMEEEKRWYKNNILKTLRTVSFKIICDFSARVCTNSNTLHSGQYFFFLKSVFFLSIVPDL